MNKFIYFILFILFNRILNVYSKTLVNITDVTNQLYLYDGDSPINGKYEKRGATACPFTYYIKVVQSNPNALTGFNGAISNMTLYTSSDSLSNVYRVVYSTPIGSGAIYIQPTFQNIDVDLNAIPISYDCKVIPESLQYTNINQSTPYAYKSFSGFSPVLFRMDTMEKYSPSTVFSLGDQTPGFRYLNGPVRVMSLNYLLVNMVMFSPQNAQSKLSMSVKIYDNSTTLVFNNNLFKYTKVFPGGSGSYNTYPTDCSSLTYWHCYGIVEYNLPAGDTIDDYYLNTFRTIYPGSPNTNINLFKVSGNPNNFKILNVLPSTVVDTTSYSFSSFDTIAKNFTELKRYQVSYLLDLDYKDPSIHRVQENEYYGVNIKFTSKYAGSLILSNRDIAGSKYYGYPFGIVSLGVSTNVTPYATGTNVSVTYDMVFPTFRYNTNALVFDIKFDLSNGIPTFNQTLPETPQSSQDIQDTTPPKLNLYDYQDQGESFAVIISVEDMESGISTIELNLCKVACFKTLNAGNLIQGNIFKGIYSIVLPKAQLGISYLNVSLQIINRAGIPKRYDLNDFYNDNFDFIKVVPYITNKMDSPDSIKSIRFSENDIDVTNQQKTVMLYLGTEEKFKDFKFTIALNFRISFVPTATNRYYRDEIDEPINSVWNSLLKVHQFEIKLPANLFTGKIPYIISPMNFDNVFLYQMFGSDSELRVFCSNADIMPPIITNLQWTPTYTIPDAQGSIMVAFNFNVSDSINGFSHGIIQISSNLDIQGWNQSLVPEDKGQDIYNGAYSVSIPIRYGDIPQTYYISYVRLVDRQGHVSEYPSETKVNPLMNYHATQVIIKTQSAPITNPDITPPELVSLKIASFTSYDVDSKIVNFTFTTRDTGSGISERHTPVVYLGLSSLDIIPSIVPISPTKNNDNSYTYQAYAIIPYTYGTADGIAISIYGIVDNSLNVAGYNSQQLQLNDHVYHLNNTISNGPEIVEASFQSNGNIVIKGYRFGYGSSLLKIKFITSGAQETSVLSSNLIQFNDKLMVTNKVPSGTIENIISVTIESPDGLISNSMEIKIPANGGGGITPTPTIPTTCKGNPVCGGPSNGQCGSDGNCVCIKPWTGPDCFAKGSGSDGSVDPNSPTVGFNYTNDAGVYKSLIVIYSLEELDINGALVNNYIFNNWSFVHIDSDHFQFNTSVKSNNLNAGNGDDVNQLTNIIVNITRFHDYKTISFAATNITMEPNSVKYSIDIDQYKFKTNLNTIRLLISTSLEKDESPDTDCQSTQFGDIADSSYIKIQIDNTVLLGRFLKRAIVDGIITTITQLPVTTIDDNDNSKSKSYIAMQIPNFKRNINIDPNFSVLVDSRNADESDPNAICSNGKSKLTTPQLIGIIVGGAVAVVAVSIFAGLLLFRSNTTFRLVWYKLFKKGFSKKVNQ